jgi:arylsulfatase A-like enzyme
VHDAGYRCGYFGKYTNFRDGFGGINAPTGYSVWREFIGGGAADPYNFDVHLNTGTTRVTGIYDTDYLASQVASFVAGSQPFFCVVAPRQPHGPFVPRTDLAGAWSTFDWPIVDEVDVTDKPTWIQELPELTDPIRTQIREDARGSLRELSAVDDMVQKIMTAAAPRLSKTIVAFTSDNGVHRGEHRRGSGTKSGPYEVNLRVPLIVRGPGFAPGPDVTAPVMTFQDLTATVLKSARGTAGLPHQAGISLEDIATNPGGHSQRAVLHEIAEGYLTQSGDGMTTGPEHAMGFRKLYRYPSVRVAPEGPFTYEAYDLDSDPDEFVNWANDDARRSERDALEAELNALLA